ncbi:MAG: hypothetical protein CMJ20_02590 [Phycisphaeraceae bacterium]|nr:hypothetical protein [Phycisphaeraceae bacterium]|tara:strand:- start:1335 stop:1775 length:441 start_codon:yes stop_codon:yes gene_type:complete
MAASDYTTETYPASKNEGQIYSLKMSNVKLYAGHMVGTNTSGYAVEGNDEAADIKILGIATETVDNSGGSAGDLSIKVKAGTFKLEHDGTLSQAEVGEMVAGHYNFTVNKAASTSNANLAGMCVEYVSATEAWVKMGPEMAERING